MSKDSIGKTFTVAFVLCLVCAIIVSSAATLLKAKQEENKLLDKQANVLKAAGLVKLTDSPSTADVKSMFSKVKAVVVDLTTGKAVPDADPAKLAPEMIDLSPAKDVAGIKQIPKQVVVYILQDDKGKPESVILPVYGRGLWSTMRGILALKGDLATVNNLTFYDHGETPGLGGEISNPAWVGKWSNKTAFSDKGLPVIRIIKGNVDPTSPNAAQQVDGISGATLTCNGVNNTMSFWLGDSGFGKYLEGLRAENN